MGVFGFVDIDVEYYDNSTEEDIKKFVQEIDDDKSLSSNIKDVGFIELSSGRIQNLEWQMDMFKTIAEKHNCVKSVNGSAYVESDLNIYYNREEESK